MKKLEWKWCLCLTLASLWIQIDAEKEKRQIFREQVLPALGGKIPEEAFKTDRLVLNRLNKEGISVPDGVLLESRHPHVKHPHQKQASTNEILKVYLTRDGRYVSPEGRYLYNNPKVVDTTYVIRRPVGYENKQKTRDNYAGYKSYIFNKPQTEAYSSYPANVPVIPTNNNYKPIVTSLVFPSTNEFFKQSYYPSWNIVYDWDTFYDRLNEYYSNIAFINSQQIITDYNKFLNDFHKRPQRHIGETSNDQNLSKDGEKSRKSKNELESINYPNLKYIPETKFSCFGRKGMFADVETKCQVFHDCTEWSKTSSLYPGTVFSDIKKRCEWWNTVICN